MQALLLDDNMRQLAKHLKDEGSLLLFGRGYNHATGGCAGGEGSGCDAPVHPPTPSPLMTHAFSAWPVLLQPTTVQITL